ncbi:conserved protein of unknown function [Azospirillum baldaniorum]|uniref:Uncharacterized protein n=1 Tax=Azospirillum baldaniorum TaxID=1064539 RepID=A0A9P1JRV0_9PROT|nr:conserved protein of unknown function [Azospirillum baldaniorum]
MLASVSRRYPEPKGRFPRVTHPCATRAEALVRLACVRHAASVRSEPGSNSQVQAGHRSEDRIHLTGPLNATSPKLSKLFVSYCLTEMLKRPAMPVPLRNRPAANGQNRRLRIPSHNTVSTISKIPRLQENRNTPRPTPSRSGPPGPECLCVPDPSAPRWRPPRREALYMRGPPGVASTFFVPRRFFLSPLQTHMTPFSLVVPC